MCSKAALLVHLLLEVLDPSRAFVASMLDYSFDGQTKTGESNRELGPGSCETGEQQQQPQQQPTKEEEALPRKVHQKPWPPWLPPCPDGRVQQQPTGKVQAAAAAAGPARRWRSWSSIRWLCRTDGSGRPTAGSEAEWDRRRASSTTGERIQWQTTLPRIRAEVRQRQRQRRWINWCACASAGADRRKRRTFCRNNYRPRSNCKCTAGC